MRGQHLPLLAVLAFVAAWFLLLRPWSLGGPAAYIIVSGSSMEPTLYTGDLVVTRRQAHYQPGDIVAFRVEGGIVIHRVVGGNAEDGFIVQGDNKAGPDSWRPGPEQILGKQWLHVPGGGKAFMLLREPPYFAAFIGGLTTFALLGGGPKRRRRRRGWGPNPLTPFPTRVGGRPRHRT